MWDILEADFQDGLEHLHKYLEKHQNAHVPTSYIDDNGFKLGSWISGYRKQYKQKKLDHTRIDQLEAIEGWVWRAQ